MCRRPHRSVRRVLAAEASVALWLACVGPALAHSNAGAFKTEDAAKEAHDHAPAPTNYDLYPATIDFDARKVHNIVIKVNARIASVGNVFVGRRVQKGEVLAAFDSAEVDTIQRTFVATVANINRISQISATAQEKMIEARMNLRWRGMAEEDIEELELMGKPLGTIPIRAPASGYVQSFNIVRDQIINAGVQTGLFSAAGTVVATIAEPDALYVRADVPSETAARLRRGARATAFVASADGRRMPVGVRIDQIDAYVDAQTQRRGVRLLPADARARALLQPGAVTVVGFEVHDHGY